MKLDQNKTLKPGALLEVMNTSDVKIIHGVNDGIFNIAGSKVSAIRASLADSFNIPINALSFVNGEQVGHDYILKANTVLEFLLKEGKKGGRYPGGKTKLSNEIVPKLEGHLLPGMQYREPFFGWGAIGLRLIKSNPISSIWINDRHPGVAAYWTSVIRYPLELKKFVNNYHPTRSDFFHLKKLMLYELTQPVPTKPSEVVELGFQKLALHRMSYSGLGEMAGGPLSDICSRWNPDALCKEISSDHDALSKVVIKNDCCTCVDFEQMVGGDDNLLYLDPPYYQQGPKCYPIAFSQSDHERLARLLHQRSGPWLLSYDDCAQVRSYYEWSMIEKLQVSYSIAGQNKKIELLIHGQL